MSQTALRRFEGEVIAQKCSRLPMGRATYVVAPCPFLTTWHDTVTITTVAHSTPQLRSGEYQARPFVIRGVRYFCRMWVLEVKYYLTRQDDLILCLDACRCGMAIQSLKTGSCRVTGQPPGVVLIQAGDHRWSVTRESERRIQRGRYLGDHMLHCEPSETPG